MTDPSVDESISQADLVFIGTVEEVGASTMPDVVPGTDSTVTVRVDDVVQAPSAFAGLAGQIVTVLMRTSGSLQPGEQATFLANGAVFGDSIAVQEIEHRNAVEATELSAQVAEVGDRARLGESAARVASAEVIVEAKVAQVRAAEPSLMEAEPTAAVAMRSGASFSA